MEVIYMQVNPLSVDRELGTAKIARLDERIVWLSLRQILGEDVVRLTYMHLSVISEFGAI